MDVFFFDFDVLDAKKDPAGNDAGRRAADEPAGLSGEAPRASSNGAKGADGSEALPGKPEGLSEAALAEENGSSCWHSAGGESSVTGAESCKSCFTWRTAGLAAPSEQGEDWPAPRLPRTDTCSSLASSW
mmetsp:Transcript_52630/g.126702  ORF Transcript_52630/g.126702 Transcript_52630/m.126702 type:complete len:130 (+) Transcript_52630:98-487(+)